MVGNPSNPYNCMTATKTPAAKEELSRLLKSGYLEPVSHPTKWCSWVFCMQKHSGKEEELKARLVTDLKRLNPNLLRAGNSLDGSSQILRRLEPDDVLFGVVNLSSDYHQVSIHPDTLPNGKYSYTTLPQGASVSSDYFNLTTNKEIRGKTGFYKNEDNVLVTSPTLRVLEERRRKLLKVCRKRNMKLNPDKLQLGREEVYGGTKIEGPDRRETGRLQCTCLPHKRN